MSSSSIARRSRNLVLWSCTVCLCAQLPACGLLETAANTPSKVAGALGPNKPSAGLPPTVLQGGVMRFADTFSARITQATKDFAALADTPEAEIQAMSWAIGQNTAAFTIASGPNTHVDLLDMLVLVTLGRMTHEEYWGPKVWHEADRPMLEAFVQLEEQIWAIAKLELSPQQQSDLRATIAEWREAHPEMGVTATVRLPLFEDLLASSKLPQEKRAGLGDLLRVDPYYGLEPTIQKLEQLRVFAERSLYYGQRIPLVFSEQLELLGLKLVHMPELQSALEDSRRISQAAASISESAAGLPAVVHAEREATVKQISEELERQRQGLLGDLERAEAPTREILGQARAALEAGTQMSTALKGTVESFDALVAHLNAPEPAGAARKSPDSAPAHPFQVSEYGEAAQRLGQASRDLTGLLTTFDQSLPQMQRVLDESAQRADRSLAQALDRALLYGALLIAGAALAALLVRWISLRWLGPRSA